MEKSSIEYSLPTNNTSDIFNSTEQSEADAREVLTNSSVASPKPLTVTIQSDSNEPMIPYEYGQQQPIQPPSLNDLNLPMTPFNVMAIVSQERTKAQQYPTQADDSPINSGNIWLFGHLNTANGDQHGRWLANIFKRGNFWVEWTTQNLFWL